MKIIKALNLDKYCDPGDMHSMTVLFLEMPQVELAGNGDYIGTGILCNLIC